MNTRKNGAVRVSAVTVVLFSGLWLASCGGYGGGGVTAPIGAPSGVLSAIVNVTDAPSDRIVAFAVTVNSLTFVRTDNVSYTALSGPRRIELAHLAGSGEPLVLPVLPQGTYKTATMDLSSPVVVYIDNSGNKVEKDFPNSTFTLNLSLDPNVVIGEAPPVLTLDINAATSVNVDPVTGNVTVNPAITIQQGQIPASSQNEIDPEDGYLEHTVGQVATATSTTFTLALSSGTNLAFTTDGNTKFEGATSTATLPLNATVRVEGRAQTNGTLLATEVEVISPNGGEMEGLVVAATMRPVPSFDIVMQDGTGGGISPTAFGSTKTVSLGSNTNFKVDEGNINLGGLNLPDFSAFSLTRGQRVGAESDSTQSGNTFLADTVKLEQQALEGVVSAPTSSQFTLTLPDDSAFRLLTGRNTLTVLTPSGTELKSGVTITSTAVLRVRGLVFFDPTTGNYSMVAGRITPP